jgi:hypothetical protein
MEKIIAGPLRIGSKIIPSKQEWIDSVLRFVSNDKISWRKHKIKE